MTQSLDLVTLGEAMVQLNATSPGPLRHVRSFEMHAAGSELNCAIAASRLGLKAGWMGKIGSDELGAFILATARSEGLDISSVRRDEEAQTGLFLVQRGYPKPDSSSSIYYRQGSAGSRLSAFELDGPYIAGARMLHFTGISLAVSEDLRKACWAAVDIAAASGSLISFDVNFRRKLWGPQEGMAEMERAFSVSNIVFCGFEDAVILFGVETPEDALKVLASYGPQRVVVTKGAEGALMWCDGEVYEGKGRPVPIVDATGAGDALAATVLAGMMFGWPHRKTIDFACVVGSVVCSVVGDFEGVPSREELEALGEDSWVPR
jgi:sugar/nucleoside kinase (ribokinase family)